MESLYCTYEDFFYYIFMYFLSVYGHRSYDFLWFVVFV